MKNIDTLTAYKCKFRYLKRNNPLRTIHSADIKAGKQPEFSFSDFIRIYQEYAKDMAIDNGTGRAIILDLDSIIEKNESNLHRWHIFPLAGKHGKPVTIVKKSTGKKYGFNSDSAALYENHIFVYENGDELYLIFHRHNGSGCKTIFWDMANKAIKPKGLKFEMELIIPFRDEIKDNMVSKITLKYKKQEKSTDIADRLKVPVIRELGLNLKADDNRNILNIIKKRIKGDLDEPGAFAQIKQEVKNDDYNEAEITLSICGKTRTVRWNEFESILGTHDISEALHKAYQESNNYVEELTKLSDAYYHEIVSSKEV